MERKRFESDKYSLFFVFQDAEVHVFQLYFLSAHSSSHSPLFSCMLQAFIKTMPFLQVTPNFETYQFMLMNYANVGNLDGVNLTIEAMTESSFPATTSCRNFALKALLHDNNTSGWEAFENCYFKHFGSDELKKDTMTDTLVMLACQKYDRVDDAVAFFRELLSSGEEIAPIVKNIFRQLIDSDELRHLYPDLSDSWEPEEAGIHMTKGADLSTNYQEIWGGTIKKISKAKIQNVRPTIRQQPYNLVCGVDVDDKQAKVYGVGDIEFVKKRMSEVGKPVTESLMEQYIKLAGKAGDAHGAYKILKENMRFGLKINRTLLAAMAHAFASEGDYEAAEEIFEVAKEAKLNKGKYDYDWHARSYEADFYLNIRHMYRLVFPERNFASLQQLR